MDTLHAHAINKTIAPLQRNRYVYRTTRMNTFETVNNKFSAQDKQFIVNSGVYYCVTTRKLKCAFCNFNTNVINWNDILKHTFSTCYKCIQNLFYNEHLRNESFIVYNVFVQYTKQLSRNGFFYNPCTKKIHCCNCGFTILKFNNINKILNLHVNMSSKCLFTQNNFAPSAPQLPFQLNQKNDNNFECVVCFKNTREICFLPCKHVVVCSECAVIIAECCVCRVHIQNKMRIFL
ncbi:IAP-2 [Urbanus proteus nucleopolyhedrovirus]|uniref:IAP-2 n=1 Tax=Urbanus proteus nucleopolyhedrovirus TaxID=1675866 RepID=A0A162GUM4_9ABAC|nr:IAP-2 [Urbanus proteus nucleopolyhedrovirus]AKR17356.1 IAP-2 [Urbanus proteus nucleopolyhedrovirus]